MGKKYKKKVQWKQLSLNELLTPESDKQSADNCEAEEGDSGPHTPTHENGPSYPHHNNANNNNSNNNYHQHHHHNPHQPHHPFKPNYNSHRRGSHRHPQGFYPANFDRRHSNENFRNLENSNNGAPPFNKPFYERNYPYKVYDRPPFYGDRNFKFGPGGFVERGRGRPFRPYGRGGFFPPRGFHRPFPGGHFRDGHGKGINGCEGEEEDEEWDDEGILLTEGQMGEGGGDRPSQPVHTVMINNEEYTKIQTPRQEVIFKKSSLDRTKRDSIDQGSVTGSMTSASGSSSTTGGEPGSGSGGSADQAAGDGSSVTGSVEDTSCLSVTGDDGPDAQHQDQVFEDHSEIFAGDPGGPPLAGVVMQQAYPGGPMITIPVHWTPFIDPTLIPGETALTPLDPAFTHVIDPKAMPIDPLHILPVQHDASGCPVHVQVKVDSNGVPIQIQPTAFTVSLSSLHQHQEQQQQQQLQPEEGVLEQRIREERLLEQQLTEERYSEQQMSYDAFLEQQLTEERLLEQQLARESFSEQHLTEESLKEQQSTEESLLEQPSNEESHLEDKLSDESLSEQQLTEVSPLDQQSTEEGICEQPELEQSQTEQSPAEHTESAELHHPEDQPEVVEQAEPSMEVEQPPAEHTQLEQSTIEETELAEVHHLEQSQVEQLDLGQVEQSKEEQTHVEHSRTEQCQVEQSTIDQSHPEQINSKLSQISNDHEEQNQISHDEPIQTQVEPDQLEETPAEEVMPEQVREERPLPEQNCREERFLQVKLTQEGFGYVHDTPEELPKEQIKEHNGNSKVEHNANNKEHKKSLGKGDKRQKSEKFAKRKGRVEEVVVMAEIKDKTVMKESEGVSVMVQNEVEKMEVGQKAKVKRDSLKAVMNVEEEVVDVKKDIVIKESEAIIKDTTSTEEETIATSPAVPSTILPADDIQGKRRRRSEEEEEEASDSNDSQYASMSESSSTPTTPAGEPSDAHEPSESRVEVCKNSPLIDVASHKVSSCIPPPTVGITTCDTETEPGYQSMETSETSETKTTTDQIYTEETCPPHVDMEEEEEEEEEGGEFANNQSQDNTAEGSENILQGYVMVPILTPYYDPSVLYGYPVVVPDQHQHPRGYSKRKKKKYQRRRHADVPAAGGFLDPQLYTGEPFVAAPGGYVVPVDANNSVCQVHGFQYMTPSFQPHPQHPDEGFVQHLPYLPGIVPDLSAQHAHFLGTNQDEAARRIFSDLQEKERRQIQEILQEQRAKVGKSDSTESSDSGVSESEEAVIAELSSDEHDTHKNDSQEAFQPCEETQGETTVDSSSLAQFEEESTDAAGGDVETLNSTDVIQERICNEENSTLAEIVQEIANELNAQFDLSDDNSKQDPSTTTDDQNQLVGDSDASIQQDFDLIESSSIQSTHLPSMLQSTDLTSTSVIQSTDSSILTTDETQSITADSSKTLPNEEEFIKADQKLSSSCKPNDSDQQVSERHLIEENSAPTFENEIIATGLTENQNDLGNKSELDFAGKETQKALDDSHSQQSGIDQVQLPSIVDDDISQTNSFGAEELQLKQENAQENTAVSIQKINEPAAPCQRINSLSSKRSTEESNLHKESLKDLKVTEAVKRWIREVTPEKAFTLSEVQTRLLEDEIKEEMDTEDEYIEDEMPSQQQSNVENSKNVEGNPLVAASSDATFTGMEGCSKRVALSSRLRGTTPDTIDDYDGSSTISNLSADHLYSEASSSQPASFSHSFDEEEVEKYTENTTIYNPVDYAKYYQLGVEVDDATPSATPLPQDWQTSRETTPAAQTGSETVSECGSEDVETVPHKYDLVCQYTATSPMSLATEILKAEKVLSNMTHITGSQHKTESSESQFGNPDIYLKHCGMAPRTEVGDSGVQSEESSDEMEGRSNIGSSGVGSSLASTPAISPAHRVMGRPTLQPHPLKNLSAGDGPVPCRTVCCAVM